MPDDTSRNQAMFQLAARLAREVELRHVGTIRVGAGLDQPPAALAVRAAGAGGRLALSAQQKHAFDQKQGQLTVEIAFRAGVAPADPAAAEVFHVEATFALVYDVRVPPAEAERPKVFEAFAAMNGTYNAWPYLREVLSSMAARLGAPPVLLPVFRPEMLGTTEGPKAART